jgi:UTP--glucose-1-phosphate uridylyltransferase
LKILIAPNALKGSLAAEAAAQAMAAGVHRVAPRAELTLVPVADGGDGLLEVLRAALDGEIVRLRVSGPLGNKIRASYLYVRSRRLALIEIAAAAGLALVRTGERDPLRASTFGVGELILDAAARGACQILLGIGGSATNDGGMGLACALGVRFLDATGQELTGNGDNLARIERIDPSGLDPSLHGIRFQVLCDVDNPLLGERGATRVFGPQKGADGPALEHLEAGLARLAECLADQLGREVRSLPGGGAAGGLGAGLFGFLGAELLPGAELVLDLLGLDQALNGADLVLTAEGRLDGQSRHGKAPAAVARRARARGIPCIALAGSIQDDGNLLADCGMVAAFSLCPGPMTLRQAQADAAGLLNAATARALACFLSGQQRFSRGSDNAMIFPSMIKKCVFPAAGYGTRFLPATKAMPKEMLPVLDKPLIQYGVEEAMVAGMTDIGIITGRSKRAIEDHFDISYELEHQISGTSKEAYLAGIRQVIQDCTFTYTRQIEMRGLGHAILTAERLVGNEPFGVILADDLCINDGPEGGVMQQMLRVYEKYRCSVVAIEEVAEDEVHKYGVIDGHQLSENTFKVNRMLEKPKREEAPSNLAIIGRYILTPEIFDIIRRTPPGKNGELQITDALQTQANENMVLAYRFKGRRFDCGSFHGYVDATNYFYQQRLPGGL